MQRSRFIVLTLVASLCLLSSCRDNTSSTPNVSQNSTVNLKSDVQAIKDVSQLSAEEEKSLTEIKHTLDNNYPTKVKVAAINKLSQMSFAAATELLTTQLTSSDNLLRQNALRALVAQNTDHSRQALSKVLTESSDAVKVLTLHLIGTIGHTENKTLLDLAMKDKNKTIRQLAEKIENKLNQV